MEKKQVKKITKVKSKPVVKSVGLETIPVMSMELPKPIIQSIEPIISPDKWGRDENKQTQNIVEDKLDKIIELLDSIESDLIYMHKAPKAELLEVNTEYNENSVNNLSWDVLFLLQKQAGDIIQRNNYPEGRYSPEMIAAQDRFEKISGKIKEKLSLITWE